MIALADFAYSAAPIYGGVSPEVVFLTGMAILMNSVLMIMLIRQDTEDLGTDIGTESYLILFIYIWVYFHIHVSLMLFRVTTALVSSYSLKYDRFTRRCIPQSVHLAVKQFTKCSGFILDETADIWTKHATIFRSQCGDYNDS